MSNFLLNEYEWMNEWMNEWAYLVTDFDEQGEDNNDKQVVKYADSSNEDEDDFESKITDGNNVLCEIINYGRRCDIVPNVTRQRCVLHRSRWVFSLRSLLTVLNAAAAAGCCILTITMLY